jgi:hypothetical protein
MIAPFPLVPLFNNQALGIALFSYDGRLCWGFNADWDLVPDLHDFVKAISESFEELRRAANLAARRATQERRFADALEAAIPSGNGGRVAD